MYATGGGEESCTSPPTEKILHIVLEKDFSTKRSSYGKIVFKIARTEAVKNESNVLVSAIGHDCDASAECFSTDVTK
jgi:hypothetical protein